MNKARKIAHAEALERERALQARRAHHDTVNHLQAAAGLLRLRSQIPGARDDLESAITQILAIAAVHALLTRQDDALGMGALVERVVATLKVGTHLPIELEVAPGRGVPRTLTQTRGIVLAVSLAELIMCASSAASNTAEDPVHVRLSQTDTTAWVEVSFRPDPCNPQARSDLAARLEHARELVGLLMITHGRLEIDVRERVTLRLAFAFEQPGTPV